MKISIQQAKRLPQGAFMGIWANHSATHLGAMVLQSLINHTGRNPAGIALGNVVQAGLGQSPARQSARMAGIENDVPCFLVNKVCASGMKAIHLACQDVALNKSVWFAGGMESLTQSPYVWARAASKRPGSPPVKDSLMHDGLTDFATGHPMGVLADITAKTYNITRPMQEEFAYQSVKNALKAREEQLFHDELIPIENIPLVDEPLTKVKLEKFFSLSPAFGTDGTITAATASSLADGASGLELTPETSHALAHIVGFAETSGAPGDFTREPIQAIEKLLKELNWKVKDVDLFEINEAFATVPVMAMQYFKIDRERINIHGGACSLGHPLGSSGSRVVVTLAHALKRMGLRRGVAALCVGGGEAMAIALEHIV